MSCGSSVIAKVEIVTSVVKGVGILAAGKDSSIIAEKIEVMEDCIRTEGS